MQVTITFNGSTGGVLAQGTTQLNILQSVPSNGCRVMYVVQSEWVGGFSASINITNTGSTTVNGWVLAFRFGGDQMIGNAWGASPSQTGNAAKLASLPYNTTIAPGTTLSGIGLNGTWTASNAAPTNFLLNAVACS
jgi:cellulase/cellobiase CelA1